MLLALVSSGCFDVYHVDPGTVVLDDFDHEDFYPVDPDFDGWFCSSFNQAGSNFSCGHDAGDHSLYSLVLRATVVDPPDQVQQSGGALLETKTPFPLDLTSLIEIDFDAKLVFDIYPTVPSDASLNLEIGCTSAEADDGTTTTDLFVELPIAYQADWTSYAAPITGLTDPTWPNTKRVKGGPAACLRRADSVRFSVDTALPDGATGSFTLNVDTVSFR
jgi:hypothetical protein